MNRFVQHTPTQLRIADFVAATEAEGPGRRFAIWLQGCPLCCSGCCNLEMLSFSGGRLISVEEMLTRIGEAKQNDHIEGITLLGGEPTAQSAAVAELAAAVRRMGVSVILFSGYTLAELRQQSDSAVHELLDQIDILVDGRYLRDMPEKKRRWIGSRNQVVHFFTSRYRADDPCWTLPNTIELRFGGRELQVNGYPSKHFNLISLTK